LISCSYSGQQGIAFTNVEKQARALFELLEIGKGNSAVTTSPTSKTVTGPVFRRIVGEEFLKTGTLPIERLRDRD